MPSLFLVLGGTLAQKKTHVHPMSLNTCNYFVLYSVYDIYDDLITRTVDGSDAHACHKLIPCCLPRCVGVQFALIAIAFQGLGIYLALVWMVADN
jgi:hypothetical protein